MKHLLLIFILSFVFAQLSAQKNYVMNPSFEQHTGCPRQYDQIKLANGWNPIDTIDFLTNCGPEYFNSCDSTFYCGVPGNCEGYQYPRSGNAYVGGKVFFDESFFALTTRDYIQGHLTQTLIPGKSYCLTFYVSLAYESQYAVNGIGAYLDDGKIDTAINTCGLALPQYLPQVFGYTIITDTINWTKIQGEFIANGTEKFITIGNFFRKADISYVSSPYCSNQISYYYIDDVSIIESDAILETGTGGIVSPGSDSVWLGPADEGMPCAYYISGNTTPFAYGGGFKVHPDTTTTYVVELDLCGHVTYDTVVVIAASAGVSIAGKLASVHLSPNPVKDVLRIENGNGSELTIYDMLGQKRYAGLIKQDNEEIKMGQFSSGIYLVEVKGENGERSIFRIVKE